MTAWQGEDKKLRFDRERPDTVREIKIPCGHCVGCKLERSRMWAVRCVHESQMHEHSCFITLTYDEEHNPINLDYSHFQKFMKRLRKWQPDKRYGIVDGKRKLLNPFRFFMCGEYGSKSMRPHFHACLFGVFFPDREIIRRSSQIKLYRSSILESLWPFGYSSIGDVTFESAAYIARYCMKAIDSYQDVSLITDAPSGASVGINLADVFERGTPSAGGAGGTQSPPAVLDTVTGELIFRKKEFCRMSLKHGIGAGWIAKYKSDVYPDGYCVMNGVKVKPPKYYKRFLNTREVSEYEFNASVCGERLAAENTPERLVARDKILRASLSQKKRSLI